MMLDEATALGLAAAQIGSTVHEEARHAAAALLLGLPVREASAVPDIAAFELGHIRIDGGIKYLADLDPAKVHDLALTVLVGQLGGPDWPPDPLPSPRAPTRDERQLARIVEHLDWDALDWRELVEEAYALAGDPEFQLLEHALASLLRDGHVLDEHTVKRVHRLVSGQTALETKVVATSTQPATDKGEFVAVAAAYSVDRGRDGILYGAFEQTISRWRASGKQVPVHWNHGGEPKDIVGSADPWSMREVAEVGLVIHGKLDLENSELARDTWRAMKVNAVGLSFGYLAGQSERSGDVRELTELDLFEISLVSSPMNPDTRVIQMKTAGAAERHVLRQLRERSDDLRLEIALGEDADAFHARPEADVNSRDVVKLQVELGYRPQCSLGLYDEMIEALNVRVPTKTLGELRTTIARIESELGITSRSPISQRPSSARAASPCSIARTQHPYR